MTLINFLTFNKTGEKIRLRAWNLTFIFIILPVLVILVAWCPIGQELHGYSNILLYTSNSKIREKNHDYLSKIMFL